MPDQRRRSVTEVFEEEQADMSRAALVFRAYAARQLACHCTDVTQLRLWLYRMGDDALYLLMADRHRGER